MYKKYKPCFLSHKDTVAGKNSKWNGTRGKLLFPCDRSHFCGLVHFRVSHQIHCVSTQGECQPHPSLTPAKCEFLIAFLNVIDLMGILPFFVSVALNMMASSYSLEYIAKAAQIFRILRILRIFKLSRHITGLKTLGTTLRNSHR